MKYELQALPRKVDLLKCFQDNKKKGEGGGGWGFVLWTIELIQIYANLRVRGGGFANLILRNAILNSTNANLIL